MPVAEQSVSNPRARPVKPLAIWLAIVAVVFGGYALVASLLRETEQVFVFVDSSFRMEALNTDDHRRTRPHRRRASDSEFALARGQDRSSELVHSWQPELALDDHAAVRAVLVRRHRLVPRGHRRRRADPDHDAGPCDTSALGDWTVVELTP